MIWIPRYTKLIGTLIFQINNIPYSKSFPCTKLTNTYFVNWTEGKEDNIFTSFCCYDYGLVWAGSSRRQKTGLSPTAFKLLRRPWTFSSNPSRFFLLDLPWDEFWDLPQSSARGDPSAQNWGIFDRFYGTSLKSFCPAVSDSVSVSTSTLYFTFLINII